MAEVTKWSVVYQGSKLFWRTRNTIDVTIVQHSPLGITEIIAFEPSINVEAKRIYLSTKILQAKLDQAEIDAKYSFAKQNNVPISAEFISSVVHRAVTDFILARLIISEFNKEESRFQVNMEFRLSDRISTSNDNVDDQLVCAMPVELEPFETKNHKLLVPGEVDAALKALKEEERCLDETCTQAAILEAEAHRPLSMKERWRIPIVLIKMDKGKVLSAEDSEIWETVSRKLKTKEDIARVTKVTVHSPTSSAQQAAKKALKHTRLHHSTPPSGRRKALDSPARTPIPTPRGGAISRTNSRLYAGTATSQSRAQCAAEDNSATRKAIQKKMIKRAHSKRQARTNSRPVSPRDPEDCADVDPEADHSEGIDASGEMAANARAGFVGQVAAGLSMMTASISSSRLQSSAKSSVKNEPKKPDACDATPPAETTLQNSAVPVRDKRRSYFGAVLAKLMRTDSGPRAETVPATDSPLQVESLEGRVISEPVAKPKPTGVSSWLPWGKGRVGSATIVPVSLVEYVITEFAAQ